MSRYYKQFRLENHLKLSAANVRNIKIASNKIHLDSRLHLLKKYTTRKLHPNHSIE